jgi:hypothetical protein
MPACLAIARPVQWVASPGGSAQVIATTRATVAAGNGGVPGGRVLSRSRPLTPCSANPALPAPHRRPANAGAPGHLRHRQPLRRQQHDPCSLHVLMAVVAIPDNRLEPGPIVVAHDHRNLLCHPRSLAQAPTAVNPLSQSMH